MRRVRVQCRAMSCPLAAQAYKQKKAALTKAQYIARVGQVLQTTKAQQVAARIAAGFRKTCKEVDDKKGAAARS